MWAFEKKHLRGFQNSRVSRTWVVTVLLRLGIFGRGEIVEVGGLKRGMDGSYFNHV